MCNIYLLREAALYLCLVLGACKNTTLETAKRPVGVLYKQGTVKDAVNFDQMNDMIVEYICFTLAPVVSKAIRTLTSPIGTLEEKPEQKYRLVTTSSITGRLPTVKGVKLGTAQTTVKMNR